jgi:putative SOS response-associated peptidase YedK
MENSYPHFVVLTREPGESISFIHDRMPFILPEEEIGNWIDPNRNPHMLLESALTDMVFEKQERGPQQNHF